LNSNLQKKTRNQRTLSHFQSRKIDLETKKLIKYSARKITEISEKFGIILDMQTLQPTKPSKQTKKRNQILQRDNKTKTICKTFKNHFSPFFNLNLHHNTLYTKNQFINLLIHLGQTKDFAENGYKTYNQIQPHPAPNADTLLYHLKNYENEKSLQKMFITLFELIWQMARKNQLFSTRKKLDVAIDFTEWYYYGNRSTTMVVGKEPDRGTSKCYKFATINIVEAGKRFTLLALPVGPFTNKEEILKQLLTFTKQRIRIRRLYVDRGFFDSKSIRLFNNMHLTYIMPASNISTVKQLLQITPAPHIITDFPMKDISFNLIIVEDEEKDGKIVKRAFATNETYDEQDVDLTERLFFLYGKRWGIETSYRVKKHSFLPKTTSKHYLIRLFYFLFSVLLYNLWILADILLWLSIKGYVGSDHIVTSKLFGTILYTIDTQDI
jgi:putative transposase